MYNFRHLIFAILYIFILTLSKYPFVTHEGSGLSSIPNQLKTICSGAIICDGIAIYVTM